ncbi:MAG: NAD(P)-dependent oxidoreductase [Gemmatimonadetes bacterium]|nr:NAD(P)-dependent oxidoreductase [Gemmatimonadota bacterium]MBT4612396.1 NAD(P)-dependent oxidoreductase [Gemmatimonadota bacterium]MBT5059493.1 NAD(P)-dependent oxidoreductase [Gemmatimonadota bacterium]MBT5146782.1 NAD(P)-dependent oxidoreductase [Gemmatimonadota bacterium]MBT5590071.1 NAD(P)-dependent oxidoreductase [Gemmatimonadota bacterium]
MNVLLVGGSGLVGTFITPYLQRQHTVRVLDVKPPQHDVDYVEGSITDPEALRRGLDGMDSFITVVMKGGQGGFTRDHTVELAVDNYQVNCLGLHVLLLTAHEMGIRCGIHTGTMSAHNRNRTWYPSEDSVPLDGPNVYGLTKALSEQICQYFVREFQMNLAVFRITGPSTRERYLERRRAEPVLGVVPTDEEDLANAYLAGLEFVQGGGGRFDAFFIAGDENSEQVNISSARALLGWEPKAHLLLS